MSPEERKAILAILASHCVARMNYQGRKGKARDAAVMDFYAGAVAAAAALSSPIYNPLAVQATMVIAPRGFSEVQKIAAEAPNATEQ